MKRLFILIAASAFLFSTHLYAQIKPVLKAGMVHSSWTGEASSTISSLVDETNGLIQTTGRVGFYAGAGVLIPLSENIFLEPALVYSQKGYRMKGVLTINEMKIDAVRAKVTSQMHYIDIPVVIQVQAAEGLRLFAGPQLSYLVTNNLHADVSIIGFSLVNSRVTITDQFNRLDAGVTGGVLYNFGKGAGLSVSFERGFNRLDRNENLRVFNQGIKAGLTFQL
jgi:hypothetical protein